jgi:hypothetical protein
MQAMVVLFKIPLAYLQAKIILALVLHPYVRKYVMQEN